MEYFVAICLALIGVYENQRMAKDLRIFYLIVILIYVVLLIGLRYRVGIDTLNYMSSYYKTPTLENIKHLNIFETRYEPGYLLLCSLCKCINPNFWVLQIAIAGITNTCIFIFIYRNCKNPFWGLIFYFILQWLYFSTEIIRESAAISIFLLNYKNLYEKKWVKYYLLSILSISFHYSAIIIWFFPLARSLKPNFIFICLCVGFIMITPLVENFNALLSIVTISDRISQYTSSVDTLNFNWRLGQLIKSAFPALTALFLMKRYKIKSKFQPMLLLQILFCAGSFAIPIIFSRFTNYTSMFVIIILSNLIVTKNLNFVLRNYLLCFVILTQFNYYYNMKSAWIPYISVLNPKIDQARENLYWKEFGY